MDEDDFIDLVYADHEVPASDDPINQVATTQEDPNPDQA